MNESADRQTNRVLVVDDDELLVNEYLRCLGDDPGASSVTVEVSDLEKALFGQSDDDTAAARFEVAACDQGQAGVEAVKAAYEAGCPYAVVFLDINMPPGIDGIEAANRIRGIDPNINIVMVTGSMSPMAEKLEEVVPPADKLFFFQKPFHITECRQLSAALCGKWHADAALRSVNEVLERRVEERTADLYRLAYFDSETQLPNQLLLLEKLDDLIDEAEEAVGDTAAVLIDIERFSVINETMGFDAGTELLRAVGERLDQNFGKDSANAKGIVGRFGADEFAILLSGLEGESSVREFAAAIKRTVEEPFEIDGRFLHLKISVGVAWHPEHGRDAHSVFRCAEAALHRSMRSVDRAVTFYHRRMRLRAKYKFDLEAELRAAIDNGQICAYYQPQQCTESGQLAGVEALARWVRPDGSVVPPADFIPLSEEIGLSDQMFSTVLNSVCKDISELRQTMDWQVPVSVNLSANQFRNKDLASLIDGVLNQFKLDHNSINLELTENVLLDDLKTASPILDDLAAKGFGIHIDDFGTGYSSLSYLAQLPVETIKIDQSFVAKLGDDENSARIIEAIVALGKAMQLEVIAEGIETDKQYAIVRQLECDLVQGYFVARPMPIDVLRSWVNGYDATNTIVNKSVIIEGKALH